MPVGVIRMPRPKGLGDISIVLAALVFIADQQRDWGAGGLALVHAGQNLNRIGFLALRDVARRARLASIQLRLNVGFGQVETRRAAIDNTADRRAMRFAESSDSKQGTEGIAGHGEQEGD